MNDRTFLSAIQNNQQLIADGATGSTLMSRGLPGGVTAEKWVLENPEMIIQLHKDFITAGSNIILTSTFSSTLYHLRGTSLEGKTREINHKAVELARQASIGTHIFIAGSLGPLGLLVKPYGPLTLEDVFAAYAEQALALNDAGADLLVIETQFDLAEIKAAIQGVRSVSGLPLVVSLSYDRGRRTMMGLSPSQAGKELEQLPVDVIGINCGKSLQENLENLIELKQVTSKPTWFKPNAGLPRIDSQGKTIYDTTPEMMGDMVPAWLEAGAQIVGGCCGTSPDHLREIAKRIKG